MKKVFIIIGLVTIGFFYSCLVRRSSRQALYNLQAEKGRSYISDSVFTLPEYQQPGGNPDKGREYLEHGNLFNSGMPYSLYKFIFETSNRRVVSFVGFNKFELNPFSVFQNGETLAAPGCLGCHAQQFNGEFIIGLGNSYSKFQVNYSKFIRQAGLLVKILYGKNSQQWKNIEKLYEGATAVGPMTILETQGPNPAHRIAHVMASHRDPVTLRFRADTSYFTLPAAVVPTDIPALWLAAKKNAWTYDGLAQGNAAKQFMISTILTLTDTSEAAAIYYKMQDVWAYLKTLRPPKYPYRINSDLAEEGRQIFNDNCSGCHGTYGEKSTYPNKLIPEKIIGTDSLLLKYYDLYNGYQDWYNKSWYATSYEPAYTRPQYGYVAQPLDGIWITAPYFHNGSVPTLQGVLNSKARPRYWKRNFNQQDYDYENVGWKYKTLRRPGGKKIYNCDIPGYGNYGHDFADQLTVHERNAVIEYLKTL